MVGGGGKDEAAVDSGVYGQESGGELWEGVQGGGGRTGANGERIRQ